MGRKKIEKKPMTEEEKEQYRAYKREYMRKYYQLNRERLLSSANQKYRNLCQGKRYNTEPIKPDSLEIWNKELEERLQEQLTPTVRIWVLSQIKWNKDQIDGKKGRNEQEDMG